MNSFAHALVRTVSVERVSANVREVGRDAVAVEEPLGIFVRHWYKQTQRIESLAVAMRTPGHDFELAVGFLHSENIVRERADIVNIRRLGAEASNEVLVELAPGVDVEGWRTQRTGFMQSSCGICGKQNVEALAEISRITDNDFQIDAELLHRLPEAVRIQQQGFSQTGGLHAAAAVDAEGRVKAVFEDIGRHNALDKLIGSALLTGSQPLAQQAIFMSSRGSFELVQKAAAAGSPLLATVGSPSTLAIDAAKRAGITLIGFLRESRFNIYSGFDRVRVPIHSEVR